MLLYSYSEMLEFRGQVLELSMSVGWGEGPRDPLGHLWVQAWTDNDLNLRALFCIISSSSPEELFLRSGNSACVCPSNYPSVNISCYRISFKTAGRIVLSCYHTVPLGV